jgi:hypothetical protein
MVEQRSAIERVLGESDGKYAAVRGCRGPARRRHQPPARSWRKRERTAARRPNGPARGGIEWRIGPVLVANGADVQARADNNQTTLDLALTKGQQDMVDFLEANGASI